MVKYDKCGPDGDAPTEQQRLYEKHLRQMSLRAAEDGKEIFELKKKG